MKKRQVIFIPEECRERIKNSLCPICSKPKTEWDKKRRMEWNCCSVKCTEELSKKTKYWGSIRDMAFKRDKYRCQICNKIPERWTYSNWGEIINDKFIRKEIDEDGKERIILANEGQLIGDHIIPIALGGDEFNLNNIQTLCIECNKIKTKEDMGKIADARAIQKKLINQEVLI